LLNSILILMIAIPFILNSLFEWLFFGNFIPRCLILLNYHIIFGIYFLSCFWNAIEESTPVMSRVMVWVKWSGLLGSIRFFYYAKSKSNIILIKKIIVKKKSTSVDMIFSQLITWFFYSARK
jgi:hypothetical protein